MAYSVIISSVAKVELQDAYDWYEEQLEGLGERFLNFIEGSLEAIAKQPLFYPVKVGAYRQYVVPKFPFVIVFEFLPEGDLIYILHIFHAKRNPEKKRS